MMPVLQIGPVALPMPALIVILGIWLGLVLAERFAARHHLNNDKLFNLALIGLVVGVAAARLAYVLRYPNAFSGNPPDIFSRNLGLFDPSTGFVVGVIASAIYAYRKQLSLIATLDALTPAFAVFSIALSLSHLASGDAYGTPAILPWSIQLWGAQRHPSQIYEAIAGIIILGYLWPSHKYLATLKRGEYFLKFVILTSGAQLFLEAFRGDSSLLPGGYRTTQVIGWLLLAVCLYAIKNLRTSTAVAK